MEESEGGETSSREEVLVNESGNQEEMLLPEMPVIGSNGDGLESDILDTLVPNDRIYENFLMFNKSGTWEGN